MQEKIAKELYSVGAHFALSKRHMHPSVSDFVKKEGKIITFDIEKTIEKYTKTLDFVKSLGKQGKKILFVSSRLETFDMMQSIVDRLGMPYVLGRWTGGTLSNFPVIRKRIEYAIKLRKESESEVQKPRTKKEGVLLARELNKLEKKFAGLVDLEKMPAAIFIFDTSKEAIAVREACDTGVPIIAIANSDTNLSLITHPILGNNNARKSAEHILNAIACAYEEGEAGKE